MPETQETWTGSLDQEAPLEKETATHSSILAWRISWPEEPGGPQSIWVTKSRTGLKRLNRSDGGYLRGLEWGSLQAYLQRLISSKEFYSISLKRESRWRERKRESEKQNKPKQIQQNKNPGGKFVLFWNTKLCIFFFFDGCNISKFKKTDWGSVLIVMVVTWMWAPAKAPWAGHLQWVHVSTCKLYLSKSIFKRKDKSVRCWLGRCAGLLWDPVLHGSPQRDEMP